MSGFTCQHTPPTELRVGCLYTHTHTPKAIINLMAPSHRVHPNSLYCCMFPSFACFPQSDVRQDKARIVKGDVLPSQTSHQVICQPLTKVAQLDHICGCDIALALIINVSVTTFVPFIFYVLQRDKTDLKYYMCTLSLELHDTHQHTKQTCS